MADVAYVKIWDYIKRRGEPVGRAEVADHFGISPSAAKRALCRLHDKGFVRRSGKVTNIVYTVPAGIERPTDGRGKSPGSVASRVPWNKGRGRGAGPIVPFGVGKCALDEVWPLFITQRRQIGE